MALGYGPAERITLTGSTLANGCDDHVGGVAALLPAAELGVVTAEQLEMISIDPEVMHGQAVLRGTRVPVSVFVRVGSGS